MATLEAVYMRAKGNSKEMSTHSAMKCFLFT